MFCDQHIHVNIRRAYHPKMPNVGQFIRHIVTTATNPIRVSDSRLNKILSRANNINYLCEQDIVLSEQDIKLSENDIKLFKQHNCLVRTRFYVF